MGKFSSSSPNVLITFLDGEETGPPELPSLSFGLPFAGSVPGTAAEMIFPGSNEPIKGREM